MSEVPSHAPILKDRLGKETSRYELEGGHVIVKSGDVRVIEKEAILFGKLGDSGVTPKVKGFKVYPNKEKARLILESVPGQILGEGGSGSYKDNPQRVITSSAESLWKINRKGVYLPLVTGREFMVDGGTTIGITDLSSGVDLDASTPENLRNLVQIAAKDDLGLRIALAKGVGPEGIKSLIAAAEIYSWGKVMAEGVLGPGFSWEEKSPQAPFHGMTLQRFNFSKPWIVEEIKQELRSDYQKAESGGNKEGENGYVDKHLGNVLPYRIAEGLKGDLFSELVLDRGIQIHPIVMEFVARCLAPDVNERPSLEELSLFWKDIDAKPERVPLARPVSKINSDFRNGELNTDLVDPKSLAEWERQKPERNALAGIIINEVFKTTLNNASERPPYGLLTAIPEEPGNRFSKDKIIIRQNYDENDLVRKIGDSRISSAAIGGDLSTTLIEDLRKVINDISTLPQDNYLNQVYRRLNSLVKLRWLNGEEVANGDPKEWTFEFIQPAAGAANSIMGGVVEAIRQVYYKDHGQFPDNKEIGVIGRDSYPVLARTASLHLLELTGLANSLFISPENQPDLEKYPLIDRTAGPFNPDVFEIKVGKTGNRSLVFKEASWTRVLAESQRSYMLGGDNSVVTGCPALAPRMEIEGKGDSSRGDDYSTVVRGLWNLYCDLLGKVE